MNLIDTKEYVYTIFPYVVEYDSYVEVYLFCLNHYGLPAIEYDAPNKYKMGPESCWLLWNTELHFKTEEDAVMFKLAFKC
jgi:hypothetical protein